MKTVLKKILCLTIAVSLLISGTTISFGSTDNLRTIGLSSYYDVKDNIIVYINWDGFAQYYYELAQRGVTTKTPVINSLIAEGAYFTDMRTGIPSITTSVQPAILAGAWANVTGNPYRYYNREQNKVIGFGRECEAENIAQAMTRQGFNVASINQFALESRVENNVYHGSNYYADRGTYVGNKNAAYCTNGNNYTTRFDGAIKLMEGQEVGTGSNALTLDVLPNFIALYMDDLDGFGHNEKSIPDIGLNAVATSEQERLDNVLNCLEGMDAKLGEFLDACKATGLYDKMTFLLTTDHGMSPLGGKTTEVDQYTYSKLQNLYDACADNGLTYELVGSGKQPKDSTQVVLVNVGLDTHINFKDSTITEQTKTAVMNRIKGYDFVERVIEKEEMNRRGAIEGYADYIVVPKAGYHFKTIGSKYTARGQHDSGDMTSQHVFALMWGNNIKPGVRYTKEASVIDLVPTLAAAGGFEGPAQATGIVVSSILKNGTPTNPSEESKESSESQLNRETSNKLENLGTPLQDVNLANNKLPDGVSAQDLPNGRSIAAVSMAMDTVDGALHMNTMTALGNTSKNVGVKLEYSNGTNIIIPGGFGAITEPGRIYYPMPVENNAPDEKLMLAKVSGEHTSCTQKIGATFDLPSQAYITTKVTAANDSVINIYLYNPESGKLTFVSNAKVIDGKVSFATKTLGQFLFTTAKL